MYSLLKFVDDDILYVTQSKRLKSIDGNLAWAPYKRLGCYEAKILEAHDSRQFLLETKKHLEGELNSSFLKENEGQTNDQITLLGSESEFLNRHGSPTSEFIEHSDTDKISDEIKILSDEYINIENNSETNFSKAKQIAGLSWNQDTNLSKPSDVSELIASTSKHGGSRNYIFQLQDYDVLNSVSHTNSYLMHSAESTPNETDEHSVCRPDGELSSNDCDFSVNRTKTCRDKADNDLNNRKAERLKISGHWETNKSNMLDNINESSSIHENSEYVDNLELISNAYESENPKKNDHKLKNKNGYNAVTFDDLDLNSVRSYGSMFDDSDEDPDYRPESDSDMEVCSPQHEKLETNHDKIIETNIHHKSNNEIHSSSVDDSFFKLKSNSCCVQNSGQKNQYVPTSSTGPKKYCCCFCQGLYSKLTKHLEAKHKNEREVKLFMALPTKGPGCEERKQLITNMRNRGSFIFNTNPNNDKLIVTRRPRSERNSNHYKMCPSCKLLYSKYSIRKHFKICIPDRKAGDRSTLILGRKAYGRVHVKASPIMKNEIIPVMREDDVSTIIRYDELIILYGNALCNRYKSKHFQKMIRSKLRLMGRFLIAIKRISRSITDFCSVFFPHQYDNVIKATNYVAFLDSEGEEYKSPATAFDIGTLLKKCGKLYITECIKKGDKKRQSEIEDFLKVIDLEFNTSVNRIVLENQKKMKREKKIDLPSGKDINLLYNYVIKNAKDMHSFLQKKFDFDVWKKLASFTLIVIQIFNRRRSGEIERMTMSEFNSFQTISNEDPDLLTTLRKEDRERAHKYVRLTIRGKLSRGVPVLLDTNLLSHVRMIIQYREKAEVPKNNPYVFGLPSTQYDHVHLNACELMRKYAKYCGASNPGSLRGTKLRKKLCTQSALLNLKDNAISDLANFMGHDTKIHKDHYRLPIISREILEISNVFEIGVAGGNVVSGVNSEPQNFNSQSQNVGSQYHCRKERESVYYSSNDENCPGLHDVGYEGSPQTRKYSGSPQSTSRRSWSTPEKEVVMKAFEVNLHNKQLPSFQECVDLINYYDEILKDRTPTQVKAWVNNKIKANESCHKSRVYWSTEEKQLMTKEFRENLESHVLPSLKMCEEVRQKNQLLKVRTARTLKAWVNNEINRRKKSLTC